MKPKMITQKNIATTMEFLIYDRKQERAIESSYLGRVSVHDEMDLNSYINRLETALLQLKEFQQKTLDDPDYVHYDVFVVQ